MKLKPKTYNLKLFQKGFTLIELVVVTAMIAIIAGISVANFRAGEKQKRAQIAVDTVISSIRVAQGFTLNGKNTNNINAGCRVSQYYYLVFGYGTAYSILANNNCGTTDLIETDTLPTNTRIKANGLVLNGTVAASNLSIVFYPPFAATRAGKDNSGYNTFTTATITVETTDGTVSKTATVDGVAGRIGE